MYFLVTTSTNNVVDIPTHVVMAGQLQTLDVASDDTEDEVDSGPEPWGRLFPQNKGFVSHSECH